MQALSKLQRAAVIAVAAAIAGCAGTTLPELSPSVPAQWRHAQEAAAPATDLRGWWHAFHDPRLDALVDEALKNNLTVAEAHERLLAARQLAGSTDANYRPHLRAKTEDAIDPDASASYFVAGFDAVWELPLFGRGIASRRQANGNLDASIADLQLARVSLVAEVVRDWLQLRAAQHSLQAQEAIRDARRRQLDLLRVRQHLQLADSASIDQAEAALARASAAVAEPRQIADAQAQSLAALLGRNAPDPQWLQADDLPDLGAWQLTSTPADLLRSRPEIARAQADVLSAAGDAGIARADLFPKLGIGGSIVWSTNLTTHKNTRENALASAGPLIDIPLFDWGLRESQLQAKNHELKASVLAYRQAVLDGVSEVENALGRLQQARTQERESDVAAVALQHASDSVAQRVRLGLDSPLAHWDSVVDSEQAQLESLHARTARGLAFVSLYKALGGAPLPDDVSEQASTQDWR